ncbi:MAG: GyrI-like domain-containing protein [Deltaproteobacteria bacterium]|nr:GyrI-like domain-containing protein [Deltaproteobacteria bacterium]
MEKIDFKKTLKHLYQPSAKDVARVEVPAMNFLMIDGEGDPNTSQAFKDAVEVVFPLSYALKFMVKKGTPAIDYGVMPLEGLWWADDMSMFSVIDKTNWKWTLMIMQPDVITGEMVAAAISEVRKKKNPAALANVRFVAWPEGVCAQIMHIGPFTEEGPAVAKVHRFIDACGCKRIGKHHEIYLSDIRKADPGKWKTVIRQPMSRYL